MDMEEILPFLRSSKPGTWKRLLDEFGSERAFELPRMGIEMK